MELIYSHKQLEEFINQNDIPTIKKTPKTFLSIAKQPHYENVLSNWYAFYFDVNEEHQMGDLFISSLITLINNSSLPKDEDLFENFEGFDVTTEFGTENQKRIDILLQNNTQAIIIENKVYHHLNNDLDEYYNEIDVPEKIGIVLSLYPISDIQHPNFINITHSKFLQTVMSNLGNYVLNAKDKYVIFLKDFFQNILNISTTIMEQEKLKFYFDNKAKINQLVGFNNAIKKHVKAEVEKAGRILEGVELYSGRKNSDMDRRYRYYVSKNNRNLLFVVIFNKLFREESTIQLIVELKNETLKDREQYRNINFSDKELSISFTNNFTKTNYNWAHFAIKEYKIGSEEISKLSSFILQKLEDDGLMSIFKKLESYLAEKSKNSPI